MSPELEAAFRKDLEKAGEASVRADYYGGGGLATGGEDRRKIVREWLREKETARELREKSAYHVGIWTFWVAFLTLLVSIAGVIATILHL